MWNRIFATLGVFLSFAGCSRDETFHRVHAEISVKPDKLEFGDVLIGTTTALAVTVKNAGTDALQICLPGSESHQCTESTRTIAENAPFKPIFEHLSKEGTWIVEKGATRQFFVSFTPTSDGPFAATLVIGHNAVDGPTTLIQMSGLGIKPRVDISPRALDFGEVSVARQKELELTLTNRTRFPQPVTFGMPQQSSVVFGVLDDRGGEVAANQPYATEVPGNGTLSLKVFYRPPLEGRHQSTLSVSFCRACGADDVALSGTGIKPVVELVPAALDFGTVEVGRQVSRSFAVKNAGNYPLTVLAIEPEAATSRDFAVTVPQLPKVLQAGERIDLPVTYTAGSGGRATGRIHVSTNAWDDPASPSSASEAFVSLTAIAAGPRINALPALVNFGVVSIGAPAASQSLVIQNSGTLPLSLSSIQVGAPSSEITLASLPALPATIASGGAITLTVRYTARNAGPQMGSVIIASNDRGQPTLTVPVQGVGATPNSCTISMVPRERNFGLVEPGHRLTLPMEIQSLGTRPCTVTGLDVAGNQEITLSAGRVPSVTLEPGTGHRIEVTYAPAAAGNHTAQLRFTSNDPQLMNASIPLTGSSAPSSLRVLPSTVDFGTVPVSCRSPNRTVTLLNTGTNPVTVTQASFDFATSQTMTMAAYNTPARIAPAGISVLTLRYLPTSAGTDNGVLFVTSSASTQPIAVPLTGQGAVDPMLTDTFHQTPSPTDVLFVIDNSCSMTPEQPFIAALPGPFFAFAQGQATDFHIGVTTTDVSATGERGLLVGAPSIITPLTPNAGYAFAQNLLRGNRGSNDEHGLDGMYLALSEPMVSTRNAGFLRPDAALAVVLISDDEDQSTRPPSFYTNFLRGLKQRTGARVTVNAIIGMTGPPAYADCMGPNGILGSYSPRYMQVVQDTGGVIGSICDGDWTQSLFNMGLTSFGLRSKFNLRSPPAPGSLRVTVDGVQVPSSYFTYNSQDNTINFVRGHVPLAYATITAQYSVACL